MVNFLVAIVKQIIYRYRCFKQVPSYHIIAKEIDDLYNTEFFIAQNNNTIRRHCIKWSCLKEIEYPDENNEFVEQYIQLLED